MNLPVWRLTPELFYERVRCQLSEIESYKRLESEKFGYDIGRNRAAREWIEKYGDAFADFWVQQHSAE